MSPQPDRALQTRRIRRRLLAQLLLGLVAIGTALPSSAEPRDLSDERLELLTARQTASIVIEGGRARIDRESRVELTMNGQREIAGVGISNGSDSDIAAGTNLLTGSTLAGSAYGAEFAHEHRTQQE